MKKFTTIFLDEANDFLATLDRKSSAKLLFVIDLAETTNDPKLFKKISSEIWEFRSKYLGRQNRLLAFWDKTDEKLSLVIATHGFVKKSQKTPKKEIEKAEKLKKMYLLKKKQG